MAESRAMMQISVQHDLERLMRKFSALGAAQINRSLNQALNRTATMARTEAVREIRKTYDFKARTVRGTFRITRARGNQAEAVLTSSGRRIRLIDMSAKAGKTGASVRVTKQRKTIKSTFIARMPTGHVGVFEREGKKRLGIKEKFTIAVPEAFSAQAVREAMLAKVADVLPRRFEHELKRAMARL